MNANLIRKLLFSIAALTAFYVIFIFIVHEDLTRPIKSVIRRMIPGILMFIIGVILHRLLINPELIEQLIPLKAGLLNIKSGFIKRAITDNMLPLIAASVFDISVTASLTAMIDKLLFGWRKKRLPYLFALITISFLTSISGATLFIVIAGTQDQMRQNTELLNQISFFTVLLLSIIMIILIIINLIKVIMSLNKKRP